MIDLDQLEIDHLQVYGDLLDECRGKYFALMESARPLWFPLDEWLLSSVGSRNTHSSDLYLRFVKVFLGLKIARENPAAKMITADLGIWQTLRNSNTLSEKSPVVKLRIAKALRLLIHASVLRFYGRLRKLSRDLLMHRRIRKWAKPTPSSANSTFFLVESYFYENSLSQGRFTDRHYLGLVAHLERLSPGQVKLFLTPVNADLGWSQLRRLKDALPNLVLRDQFLHWQDHFWAMHSKQSNWKILTSGWVTKSEKVDFWPLIAHELLLSKGSEATVNANLNRLFVQRLAEAGCKLNGLLTWFENQTHSRGLILGVRKTFPNANLVGYLGFPPVRDYHCLYPLMVEKSGGVLPDRLFVSGNLPARAVGEYCPGLSVYPAPSLRFHGLWDHGDFVARDSKVRSYLIALTSIESINEHILSCVAGAVQGFEQDLVVRPHPSLRFETLHRMLRRHFGESPFRISKERTFLEDLLSSSLLITAASSVALEAVSLGVRTVAVCYPGRLSFSSVPKGTELDLYRLCYSESSLAVTLAEFGTQETDPKSGILTSQFRVRDAYFVRPEEASVATFAKNILRTVQSNENL